MRVTPFISGIVEDFIRYYETPFAMRSESLTRDRNAWLKRPGTLFQEPLIEAIPRYRTVKETLAAVTDQPFAEMAHRGLFPPTHPYVHQAQAIRSHRTGRNVVVTAGTGSGKTECFMLPIAFDLYEEAIRDRWSGRPPNRADQWWMRGAPYVGQRSEDDSRTAAVRALLVYPMNALVEDQIRRLRRGFDSTESLEWFDDNLGGHRFHFGRYTGRTPVSGPLGRRLDDYRADLREAQYQSDALDRREAAARSLPDGEEKMRKLAQIQDERTFMARLGESEMFGRWDMIEAPPDILITNFSMLNVMLTRHREDALFSATERWLREDARNMFTIVVDELHMYRGTAGTETALLVRNVLDRFGLKDGLENRFKVITTTASLGNDEHHSRRFLSEFLRRSRVIRLIFRRKRRSRRRSDYISPILRCLFNVRYRGRGPVGSRQGFRWSRS